MQDTFGREAVLGPAGEWGDLSSDKEVLPRKAAYDIEFGSKMSYTDAKNTKLDTIGTNLVEVVLVGDVDASDTLSLTLKVYKKSTKTEAVYTPSVTYSGSESNTLGTVFTATLEGYEGINAAGTGYNASTNLLSIKAEDGYCIEVSGVTLGGGSTVTVGSQTNYDTRNRAGFAGYTNKQAKDDGTGTLVSKWFAKNIVKNKVKGNVITESTTGYTPSNTLYYIGYGENRGKIANAAGNNGIAATDIKVRRSANSANTKGIVNIDS